MENEAANQSVITSDVEITGTIKTSGGIQIHGRLNGDLECAGDATVGKSGQIKGNIVANAISIAGTINGNMTAKDRIEMKSSAKVQGDIKSKRLAVEDGVTFVGKSEVNPSGGAAATAPSTPPASSSLSSPSTDDGKGGGSGVKR